MPRRFGLSFSLYSPRLLSCASLVLMLGGFGYMSFSPISAEDKPPIEKSSIIVFKVPSGLPEIIHPADNPITPEKVALGAQLYFDPRLSSDGKVSCASCHDPAKGWSNGEAVATGVNGLKGGRSAPTVLNTAFQVFQFWDGRMNTLEEQALGPIQNPIEMNMTLPEVVKRLNGIPGYKSQFQKVFKTDVTSEGIGKAIAAFERTVLSGDSPYDRFTAGDAKALSPAAERGRDLFFGAARCSSCHSGPNFTDNAFHNIGIGMHHKEPDHGRYASSKLEGDKGAFKTPTLRDIARSAPYMHDGSLKTLEEVVAHYNKGGFPNEYLDEEIFPLKLTKEQIADLVTFMKEGLSSSKYPDVKPPKLP
ncbi:MAG: Cytochrome-c peroxidase [Planctomycetaceae bacterium]|nr:Cytochrome-c peroxidase [Planctomycetaceae bacterium]